MTSAEELLPLIGILKVMNTMRLKRKLEIDSIRRETITSKIRKRSNDPLEIVKNESVKIKIEKDNCVESEELDITKLIPLTSNKEDTCKNCDQSNPEENTIKRKRKLFEFANKLHKQQVRRQNHLIHEMRLLQNEQNIHDKQMEDENRKYWSDLILKMHK